MSVQSQETIKLISAGLKVGIKAYESAMRLSAAGYYVPGFKDFQRQAERINVASGRAGGANSSHRLVGHA
ncbi:hypothetical protein [Halodesulfovibrio marinisediminis]|uniref:Uncharacterized protein n=1 Tax=Halodesulfovibrio marinisediminis DSM 17456 TaxID=1121457 RepID=A0A1N6I1M5_9BACT|nr:hypothetical protein [Halodesulfovibrio marinisediminis]SIO25893.1 hypothetical protein SAMN02745161_2342 [Halodesulfovibrio marinisediminis DSM 17456]